MENKKVIVAKLQLLLKSISAGENIEKLVLDEKEQFVTIHFIQGGTRRVCVEGDSGIALIKDVINRL